MLVSFVIFLTYSWNDWSLSLKTDIYIDSLDIHRCKNKITFPFKQRKANILTLFRIHKSTNGELSIILSKVLKH